MPIFEPDERFIEMDLEWDQDTLLNQEGLFYLKDILKPLSLKRTPIIARVSELIEAGKNPYAEIGIRKAFNQYIVRMRIFKPFAVELLKGQPQKMPTGIDSNQLLSLHGVYLLSDVCKHIPFSPHQLRYQAKKHADPRSAIGIWKESALNRYVVDMDHFARWLGPVWLKGRSK